MEYQPIKEGSRLTNDLQSIYEAQIEKHLRDLVQIVCDPELLAEVIYTVYQEARETSPQVSPYDWEAVFGKNTAKMELRFALEEYAKTCAETGTVFHHLGRSCDEPV